MFRPELQIQKGGISGQILKKRIQNNGGFPARPNG